MHGVRRERRQAESDVLGAAREWSRVADPFAAVRDDSLPGGHIQFAGFMPHPQLAPQNHRVLVKFRSLSRFLPTFRAVHMGHANAGGRGVDTADVLLNDLRFTSGGFDARRLRNQSWHNGEAW